MLDYTSIEVLLKERTAERDREALKAGGGDGRKEQPTPAGAAGYDYQPAEAPLIWVGGPGEGETPGDPMSEAASAAANSAEAVAEGTGEAATGFLEAAAHIAGEVLQVLGAILSALGDADFGE